MPLKAFVERLLAAPSGGDIGGRGKVRGMPSMPNLMTRYVR
jgi:hypothetical protein